jgi:hypothetical protein
MDFGKTARMIKKTGKKFAQRSTGKWYSKISKRALKPNPKFVGMGTSPLKNPSTVLTMKKYIGNRKLATKSFGAGAAVGVGAGYVAGRKSKPGSKKFVKGGK